MVCIDPSEEPAEPPELDETLPLPAGETPAPPDDAAGEPETADTRLRRVGAYLLRRRVRRWEYGAVYRATHPRLEREVELVLVEGSHAADAGKREGFLQAARHAAAVEHPYVEGGLFEAGACGPVAYLAREPSRCEPLEGFGPPSSQRRHAIYPNRALATAAWQAAVGLEAIHQAGVHHGRLDAACLRRDPLRHCVQVTRLGRIPTDAQRRYAERLENECGLDDPIARDLFGLGAALYELVGGSRPDPDRDAPWTPYHLARRLRRLNPGIDRETADIIGRCLSMDRHRRYRSAEEVVGDLAPLARRPDVVDVSRVTRSLTLGYDGVLLGFLTLMAFAVTVLALLAFTGGKAFGDWPGPAEDAVLALTIATLTAVPVLYFGCEIVFGCTPGRFLHGVTVVDASGARPDRWRLVVRAGLRLSASAGGLAGMWGLSMLADPEPGDPTWLVTWLVPLALVPVLDLAAVLLPGRRPLHDRLAGVRLGRRPDDDLATFGALAGALAPGGLTIGGAESTSVAGSLTPSSGLHPKRIRHPLHARRRPEPPAGGRRLGGYALGEMLGKGGMGAVYLAWDEALHRPVAVKVIDSRRVRSREPYLVMEYVAGRTLQQRVEQDGPLPVAAAWDAITQAATGLGVAAQRGIIHRDVKPANLMLAEDGAVKVMDFGVSKLTDDPRPAPVAGDHPATVGTDSDSLTRTGALLGTPQYMAPEQASGEAVDGRADIYSLGLTLHCLLTGTPPFAGSDLYDLIDRHRHETPPPLTGVADWTPARQAVLDRMLAKDPADRFQTCEQLLAALAEAAPRPLRLASVAQRLSAELVNLVLLILGGIVGPALVLPLAVRAEAAVPQKAALVTYRWDVAGEWLILAVYVVGIGLWGQTPGKWLAGIRVCRPDGASPGWSRALVRYVVLYVGTWPLPITTAVLVASWWQPTLAAWWHRGWGAVLTPTFLVLWLVAAVVALVTMSVRPDRRTLHDLAADTAVVRVPPRPGSWWPLRTMRQAWSCRRGS